MGRSPQLDDSKDVREFSRRKNKLKSNLQNKQKGKECRRLKTKQGRGRGKPVIKAKNTEVQKAQREGTDFLQVALLVWFTFL